MIHKKPTLQQLARHGGIAVDESGKWLSNKHWILDIDAVTLTTDAAVAQALKQQWMWKWNGMPGFRLQSARMDFAPIIDGLKKAADCKAEMLPIIYDGDDIPQRVFATHGGLAFFKEDYIAQALGTAFGAVEWRADGPIGILYMLCDGKLKAVIMPRRPDDLPQWIAEAFPPKPKTKE